MTVTVMIATRNRVADLAVTLAALECLEPRAHEILVTLDGCTDGSAELVRQRFPAVRVIDHGTSQGSIQSRDQMLRGASGDLVLSLDDDSYPVESDFLAKAIDLFRREPALAVLTFPQRSDEFPLSLTQQDFGQDCLVGSYASSAAMLRRSAYLARSGYYIGFFHIYEEPDFALQCIAHGQVARLHTSLTIRHHYSPKNRNEIRIHHLHARNEQWSILLRCPSPWWPWFLLRRAVGQFVYACRRGPRWAVSEPQWWWAAVRGAGAVWRDRAPVPWRGYRRWLKLLRSPESLPDTSA